LLLFVIFLKTTPSYMTKYKVFIGTMLRQLFIHLWLIIHKSKWQRIPVLLLYQTETWHCSCPFVSKQLYSFPSGKLKDLSIIYYISDGAASYNNGKNFINLCYHKDDSCMDAKSHLY
jgi:hypothetical protein